MTRLRSLLLNSVCTLALMGCSALNDIASVITGRPPATANADALDGASLELRAYAVIAYWAEMQEQAARIAGTETTSADLRNAIRIADAETTPVMLALSRLAESYAVAVAEGATQDKADEARMRAMLAEAAGRTTTLAALVSISGDTHDKEDER